MEHAEFVGIGCKSFGLNPKPLNPEPYSLNLQSVPYTRNQQLRHAALMLQEELRASYRALRLST